MSEPIGRAYKPWVILSVVVLVLSLMLLAAMATIAFVLHSDTPVPLWITLLGAVAALGVGLGFAGFFGMMLVAGWSAWREGRRVQVIPPRHD